MSIFQIVLDIHDCQLVEFRSGFVARNRAAGIIKMVIHCENVF